MGFGAAGAIGSALGALGQGITKSAEQDYAEQLRLRVEASRSKRDENLQSLKNGYAKKLKDAQDKLDKANLKGPKLIKETFSKGIVIDGKSYNNVEVTMSHNPNKGSTSIKGFPNYDVMNINPLAEDEIDTGWTVRSFNKDYRDASKKLKEKENQANLALELFTNKDREALADVIGNNTLAKLMSNASNSIKEPDKFSDLGDVGERFAGYVNKFLYGEKTATQYKDIEDMLEMYVTIILPYEKKLIDDEFGRQVEYVPGLNKETWQRQSGVNPKFYEKFKLKKQRGERRAAEQEKQNESFKSILEDYSRRTDSPQNDPILGAPKNAQEVRTMGRKMQKSEAQIQAEIIRLGFGNPYPTEITGLENL